MRTLIILLTLLTAALVACDPLAPIPTPTAVVLIVSPEPSATQSASPTPTPSPLPSFTPTATMTPTATIPPCQQDGGQFLPFDEFRSPTARENLRYRVYVPPCYLESQRRYPYLILLHGLGEDELQWDEIGVDEALEQGMRLRVLGPMLIVLPDYGNIGAANRFPPDPSYETVLMEELVPAIERDFCTWNDPRYRAIGGISRGGFWALSVALRHPDIFGAAGAHSGALDPDNAPDAYNPLDLALSAPFLAESGLRFYLDNAASDPAGTNLELFSSRLSSRGIPHSYVVNPVGRHDNDYWASHVAEYLTFYAQNWPRDLGELPSCLEPSP